MSSSHVGMSQGARWWQCALQVNPFAYLAANGKAVAEFTDEDSYNAAMVEAFAAAGVDAIAIMDHWRVDTGESLRKAAVDAGITVFPGFEATSKEGVHLLIIYDPAASVANINRHIGECGIPADCVDARPGNKDTLEILACADRWGAAVIAAHVTSGGGLLDKLSGQTAAGIWTDNRLHAVAHGGVPLSQAHQSILANKDSVYRRSNPVAVLRAADVSKPEDVLKSGSRCWIKLSTPTIGALDLAFRTPDTRVTNDNPATVAHPVIRGIRWEGGFLDDVAIRFNESLNVLIGGRGSGKSTVLESVRYVFGIQPLGYVSANEHDAMINGVLGAGAKISVEVETQNPRAARFTIERLVGSAPVVRDSNGDILKSTPVDILNNAEAFGQRELAELARDKVSLTSLLSRYLPPTESNLASDATHDLAASRSSILKANAELSSLHDRASRRLVVAERLEQFKAAGVEEKLREHEEAQREDAALMEARASLDVDLKLSPFIVGSDRLDEASGGELPRQDILLQAKNVIETFNQAVSGAENTLRVALQEAQAQLDTLSEEWRQATSTIRDGLALVLRELQPDGVDGDEYLRLKKEWADLANVPKSLRNKQDQLAGLRTQRHALLIEIEDGRAARLRSLQKEAKKVSKRLQGILRANVRDGQDRSALVTLLADGVGGRLDRVRTAIETADALSPRSFVDTCRQGADAIIKQYPKITPNQASQLAGADEETLLLAEELDFPLTTDLELNVGSKDDPVWRSLDNLSTGQKATALLLLLMHRGDGPLIIDQPEDDLDNRFIFDDIVPRLRSTKGQRQVIVSSHNANIPVLGDAEQIVALSAEDDGSGLRGSVIPGGSGSIDQPIIRRMIEELLEGGREAFNTRRYLYGF